MNIEFSNLEKYIIKSYDYEKKIKHIIKMARHTQVRMTYLERKNL